MALEYFDRVHPEIGPEIEAKKRLTDRSDPEDSG